MRTRNVLLSIATVLGVVVLLGAASAYYLSDKMYLRFEHASVGSADFHRKFMPAQLADDFNFLTRTVEHIHPDVNAIMDPSTYEAKKAAALERLNHPMDRAEFFRVLAPFAGTTYNEGHTEIMALKEEWTSYKQKGGRAPPFAVSVRPDNLTIVASLSGANIPPNSSIVSINSVDAASLCRWLIDTQSMETEAAREAFAAARFAERAWSYGIRPPYTIVYRAPGAAETATLRSAGTPASEWELESTIGKGEPVALTIERGVAHLVLKDFQMPFDKYEGWLKDAFQRIHDAHVGAVVLDLRDNSGGDSRESDELQAYLSDMVLPAVAEVDVKTTPEVKAVYRTLLPESFRWVPLDRFVSYLRGIQDAPDNGFFRFHPESAEPVRRSNPKTLAFNGPLYLLVGPYTYSTALIAAEPYKYWKRATVIGQQTEEGLTFYGDYYEFDLPNSKIQMHVSHKLFRLVGSSGRHSQLIPDIATSPEHPDAYQLTLDVISHRRQAGP